MPRAASGLYQKKTFRHGSPPPLLEHFYKEDHTQKTQKIQYIANCGAPGHHPPWEEKNQSRISGKFGCHNQTPPDSENFATRAYWFLGNHPERSCTKGAGARGCEPRMVMPLLVEKKAPTLRKNLKMWFTTGDICLREGNLLNSKKKKKAH